jgi:hypothetical protein
MKNQRLDLVEGSTSSKMEGEKTVVRAGAGNVEALPPMILREKKNAQRGGAGNVEAPAPTTTERIDRTLSGSIWDKRT